MILSPKKIKTILKEYNLTDYKEHEKLWWSIKNEIFLIKTEKDKLILKIYNNTKEKEVERVLQTIQKLKKENVPIPNILKTKSGREIIHIEQKPASLQKFIEGEHYKKADKTLVISLAKNLGKIDKILLKDKNFTRLEKSIYKIEQKSRFSTPELDIFKEKKEISEELNQKVKSKKIRITTIHGDYQSVNILVKENKIKAILDWDELRKDYLPNEIATAINHLFFTFSKANKKYLPDFFKEYKKYVKLTKEEKELIYPLIKLGMICSIEWCEENIKKHKSKAEEFSRWSKETIKSYIEFKEISPRNFIQLLK